VSPISNRIFVWDEHGLWIRKGSRWHYAEDMYKENVSLCGITLPMKSLGSVLDPRPYACLDCLKKFEKSYW
jgi:hypothetical protein